MESNNTKGETKYKYFIEDIDTGLWYRSTILEEPTVHTYGVGYDKPEVTEYWTNDPHQALSVFKDKEDAELWLAELMDRRYYWFQNTDYTMKNLKVTEHEFVGNCNCKKGECCYKCAPTQICPETKKECVQHPSQCNTVCWELQYGQRVKHGSVQKPIDIVYYNMAKQMTQKEFSEWLFKVNDQQIYYTPLERVADAAEVIRKLNSVLIHFSTLDKMPTLGLLDREGVIEHVVNIAKEKLVSATPSKEVERGEGDVLIRNMKHIRSNTQPGMNGSEWDCYKKGVDTCITIAKEYFQENATPSLPPSE